MGNPSLSKLTALVVDDFSSFRSTIMGMLNRIGIKSIEEAAKGQEAIKYCKEKRFDLILCDYNLGPGRNGQQLLEEIRFRNWISYRTLFFMVTAESSKEMVLSAYDCEPNDYLTKPLNLRVLEQRISRQVQQRDTLLEAFKSLDEGNQDAAIKELEVLVEKPGRHNLISKKLLAEQYLIQGNWQKAESLYQGVMQSRRLDWAVLGMAKVLDMKGQSKNALKSLEQLTLDSRLYLPAYDELAAIHERSNDFEALQEDLERVTGISPRSILRQRKLAHVAAKNGHVVKSLRAAQEAMKLGERSCYSDTKDHLEFLTALGNAVELQILPEQMDATEDGKKCLNKLLMGRGVNADNEAQAKLLTARVMALEGDVEDAKKLAAEDDFIFDNKNNLNIDRDVSRVLFLNSCEQYDEANAFIEEMLVRYAGDPDALRKIDRLLPEPKNEMNRRQVAKLNKIGIDAYQQGQFDEAADFFARASILYPRHVGIQLNRLQTLVGKIKLFPDSNELKAELKGHLDKLSRLLTDPNSKHFARYETLREKAKNVLS